MFEKIQDNLILLFDGMLGDVDRSLVLQTKLSNSYVEDKVIIEKNEVLEEGIKKLKRTNKLPKQPATKQCKIIVYSLKDGCTTFHTMDFTDLVREGLTRAEGNFRAYTIREMNVYDGSIEELSDNVFQFYLQETIKAAQFDGYEVIDIVIEDDYDEHEIPKDFENFRFNYDDDDDIIFN